MDNWKRFQEVYAANWNKKFDNEAPGASEFAKFALNHDWTYIEMALGKIAAIHAAEEKYWAKYAPSLPCIWKLYNEFKNQADYLPRLDSVCLVCGYETAGATLCSGWIKTLRLISGGPLDPRNPVPVDPQQHIYTTAFPCCCDRGYHNSGRGGADPISQHDRERMMRYSFGPYHLPDTEPFQLRQMAAPAVRDYVSECRRLWDYQQTRPVTTFGGIDFRPMTELSREAEERMVV